MSPLFQTNFGPLDWGIVAVYLVTSIAIGLWANRYVGNLSDFLVAGRTLRIRLALATMTGTELGLITVMYMSELGFTQQYACLYLAVLETVSLLLIGLTGFVVYRLRESAVLTIPEYYQRRYSPGVRVVGGTMMVVSGVLNMGLFLKAGSQFLTAISGLEEGLFLNWIMTAILPPYSIHELSHNEGGVPPGEQNDRESNPWIIVEDDFEAGLAKAREQGKLALINWTGHL